MTEPKSKIAELLDALAADGDWVTEVDSLIAAARCELSEFQERIVELAELRKADEAAWCEVYAAVLLKPGESLMARLADLMQDTTELRNAREVPATFSERCQAMRIEPVSGVAVTHHPENDSWEIGPIRIEVPPDLVCLLERMVGNWIYRAEESEKKLAIAIVCIEELKADNLRLGTVTEVGHLREQLAKAAREPSLEEAKEIVKKSILEGKLHIMSFIFSPDELDRMEKGEAVCFVHKPTAPPQAVMNDPLAIEPGTERNATDEPADEGEPDWPAGIVELGKWPTDAHWRGRVRDGEFQYQYMSDWKSATHYLTQKPVRDWYLRRARELGHWKPKQAPAATQVDEGRVPRSKGYIPRADGTPGQ